jgi:phosphoribosyl-dephospho-CoA transferase
MFSRHDLVWLTAAGWDVALAVAPPAQHAALCQWRDQDWPAVVRRHETDSRDDVVCLGIPLPLSSGLRQRLALVCRIDHIARRAAPVPLADAIAAAPTAWLAGLVALQRAASAFDLRAYGSLAMASLTGQAYLRAGSDIDLLLRPAGQRELGAGVALLEQHGRLLPLDGEIVFPSGEAVSWKEWLAARRDRARVLVKSLHAVRLVDPAVLAATLPAT